VSVTRLNFDRLSNEVADLLSPAGFSASESERDGPFGSHYTEFSSGRERCRVVWDGKDAWLLAEHAADASGGENIKWKDLVVLRLGHSAPGVRFSESRQQLLDSIRSFERTRRE
jgi:hypothetical protein